MAIDDDTVGAYAGMERCKFTDADGGEWQVIEVKEDACAHTYSN